MDIGPCGGHSDPDPGARGGPTEGSQEPLAGADMDAETKSKTPILRKEDKNQSITSIQLLPTTTVVLSVRYPPYPPYHPFLTYVK